MGYSVKVENLSVVFGTDEQKKEALKLIEEGHSQAEIKDMIGATVANKEISFEINENELFVIVGLSGSGKSTFIRTLNLLNIPTAGKIIVDGKDITTFNKEELRAYRRNDVSMIFQHFGLFSHRSVIANVEYPLEIQGIEKKKRHEKAMEAIERVGLAGWEDYLPKELSGGMRQRVGLARALTNDPKLMLMDEPYSALDPLIRRDMQNELLALEDDIERTIVFITHDMNEAFRMGDRIALMKDGEVVQIGTPDVFFDSPANDYVRDFIADVDKSRILKVRNVMRKVSHGPTTEWTAHEILEWMEEKESDVCYLTDAKEKFVGMVEKVDVEKAGNQKAKAFVKKEGHYSIYRNAYLKDIWNELKDANYDVPVVDATGRLRGVLGYDDILKALAD
ncbi:MAG: betaine/proline/choline family ABC transporter ATP-binding protein [Acholeplasmataceae bacterium]|nr:betaine/proline/choline family ABC transporter ATP-binding protein [Acholeplasmataceae bacterium]